MDAADLITCKHCQSRFDITGECGNCLTMQDEDCGECANCAEDRECAREREFEEKNALGYT